MTHFILNDRIENDTAQITDLPLSAVRLIKNKTYPWLVLVPQKHGITELHQLEWNDQVQLLKEINMASDILERLYSPDKLNVATLGNMVPQLHLHVIARTKNDPAWPGPVWGHDSFEAYDDEGLADTIKRLKQEFAGAQV